MTRYCITIVFRPEHPSNTLFPSDLIEEGNSILSRDEHPLKEYEPNDSMKVGILTFTSVLKPLNAPDPIDVIPFVIDILLIKSLFIKCYTSCFRLVAKHKPQEFACTYHRIIWLLEFNLNTNHPILCLFFGTIILIHIFWAGSANCFLYIVAL